MVISLPAELEKRLEAAAHARGLPVDAYARGVLEEATRSARDTDRKSLWSEIDRIRAMTPPGPKTDSATLLQQVRDERYGR